MLLLDFDLGNIQIALYLPKVIVFKISLKDMKISNCTLNIREFLCYIFM